jgi:hypothetical protein
MKKSLRSVLLFLGFFLFFAASMALPVQNAGAQEMLIGTTGTGSTISTLVEIDPATGNLIRTIGSVGYTVNGLVYDHTTGKLFAGTSVGDPSFNGLIEINLTTGAGTPIGASAWGLSFGAVTNITVDSAGQMYGWWEGEDSLVSIDKTTGIATLVGLSGIGTARNGLDFDNSGTLFMVNSSGMYYTVDTTTGLATYVDDIGSTAHHGKFRPTTNIWYGINDTTGPRSLVLADLSTGDVIDTIPTVDNLHTLEFVQVLMYGVSGGGNSNPGSFMTINQLSGEVTILDTPYGGAGLSGVATDSSGRVFAVTGIDNPDGTSHLIEINPVTGAMISDIGPMYDSSGNGCAIGDLSFQPGTNILFGLAANQSAVGTRCGVGGYTGGYLLTINMTTAQYTIIGRDPSFENDNGGIAFAPDGTLYFTPAWWNTGFLHTLDPATAEILTSVALPSGEGYMGLAVRPSDGTIFGSYRYYTEDTGIYTIDPVTGAETLFVDPGDIMVHDLTFPGGGLICVMPFTDVPSGFWAEDYIRALYCEGIANGYADNTFRPSQNANRAQTAAFIIRAQFGEDFLYSPTAHFTDVPDSHWAFKYVQKMYDEGISTGYPDGTFRPSQSVSRSQAAALIIKTLYPGGFMYTLTPFFSDVPDSHWAFQYVQKMYDDSITTGYADGTYRPSQFVSRSQISAFIARAFLGMD